MNKKLIIALFVVILLFGGWLLFDNRETKSPIKKTETTDPAAYQRCVDSGGVIKSEIAPSSCTLNGVIYYDGNF